LVRVNSGKHLLKQEHPLPLPEEVVEEALVATTVATETD
jgi:hypothetical protein